MAKGKELDVVKPTPEQAIAIRETVASIKARVQLVQHVKRDVMKPGIHYGKIPGTGDKDTLLKPGAEILNLAFQFGPRYITEDLSCLPELVRYRMICELYSQVDGSFIASGQGEASSDEEKYRWRKAVNEAEYEATPEDRRRVKYGRDKESKRDYTIKQVRIEPADIANTVLKMCEKRSHVDATRTASACSDMFSQDFEDLPAEILTEMMAQEKTESPPLGEKDYKKLLVGAKRYGYTEADVLATAQVQGYEGPGADMPADLAERIWAGMGQNPKVAQQAPTQSADLATGEVQEAQNGGFRTPLMEASDGGDE